MRWHILRRLRQRDLKGLFKASLSYIERLVG
jgi:hypothetical protein